MSDFRRLSNRVMASPQISLADIEEAKAAGVTLIINNRPDGESYDQVPGDDIAHAATTAGIEYVAIPITQAGFSLPQVDALREALDRTSGQTLAYCRSGTRSTLLWALAEAKKGTHPDKIAAAAREAGYDVAPVQQTLEMLATQARV